MSSWWPKPLPWPRASTRAGMASRRTVLEVDGVFVEGPEDRISAQRWVFPTRFALHDRGVSCGTLWVAPCDWAHHVDFLRAVKATFLWECLDQFCKGRAKVTQRREAVLAKGPWKFIQVAYCTNAHHRSVGSVVAFMVDRMGHTVAGVAEMMKTHERAGEVRDGRVSGWTEVCSTDKPWALHCKVCHCVTCT